MKPSPAISVIMSMFNSERFVAEAVESVLAQSFGDFEFLIVDDGSTDRSAAIVAELARKDRRIQLFKQPNKGVVESLNFLIAQAKGQYLARMDSDDICLPERFSAQVKWLESHPRTGALGTQTRLIDQDGANIDGDSPEYPVGTAQVRQQLSARSPLCNPSVMLRKDAVDRIKGYRPAFRYCEDYDLFLRLSRTVEMDNLPDALLLYRRTDSQMSVRHNGQQTLQSVLARFAHHEVLAGRQDPFDGLAHLPELDQLDAVVGRPGVSAQMRFEIAKMSRYNRATLAGSQFEDIRTQVAKGHRFPGVWRTVARCLRMGLYQRAALLTLAIVGGFFTDI